MTSPLVSARAARLLLVALLALAAAWTFTARPVPLYDGVGFPDEPYRYVAAPAGYKHTPPPSTGVGTAFMSNGVNRYAFYVNTKEQGPQFSLFVPDHLVGITGVTGKIRFTATPMAPDSQPPGARPDGNVYRLAAATTGSQPARFLPSATKAGLQMRATTARQPGPTMYYRPPGGGGWQALDTVRGGNDIYSAFAPGPGDYVLAFTHPIDPGGGSGSGPPWALIVVLIVVLGVMTTVVLLVRRSRTRATA